MKNDHESEDAPKKDHEEQPTKALDHKKHKHLATTKQHSKHHKKQKHGHVKLAAHSKKKDNKKHNNTKLASQTSKDDLEATSSEKIHDVLKDTESVTRKADSVTSSASSLLRHLQSDEHHYDYKDKKYYGVDHDAVYRPSRHLFDDLDDDSWLTNFQRNQKRRHYNNNRRYKKWFDHEHEPVDHFDIHDDIHNDLHDHDLSEDLPHDRFSNVHGRRRSADASDTYFDQAVDHHRVRRSHDRMRDRYHRSRSGEPIVTGKSIHFDNMDHLDGFDDD